MALIDNQPQVSQMAPQGNQTGADPLFEKRVLELQRRENEVRKQQAAMKDHVSWDQLKDMVKKDRTGLFSKLGIDPQSPLEDPNDPMSEIRRELNNLKSQRDAEAQAKARNDYQQSIRDQLKANSEKYELIELLGAHDQLFSYLDANKGEDGSPLDPLEIADQLENSLYQRLESVKPAKKLASWFDKTPPAQNQFGQPKTNHPLDTRNTLTSSDRSTSERVQAGPVDRVQSLKQAAQFLKYTNPEG